MADYRFLTAWLVGAPLAQPDPVRGRVRGETGRVERPRLIEAPPRSHHAIMRWGAEGLARSVGGRLIARS